MIPGYRNLVLFLAIMILGQESVALKPDCDGLKASSVVGNGSVEIKVEGGKRPYVYVYFDDKGIPFSDDFDKNKVENIDPGKYYCAVVDSKGCKVITEFTIE